jgi:putative addiction module CopG family antidote
METHTMQITIDLPENLAIYFQDQITTGEYPSASDYIQALIRADQARKNRLEALAIAGVNSGPSTPMTQADWHSIRAAVRQNLSPNQ